MYKLKATILFLVLLLVSVHSYAGGILGNIVNELTPGYGEEPDRITKPIRPDVIEILEHSNATKSADEDPEIEKARKELLLLYINHLKQNMSDSSQAVKWNHRSSNIVLISVHLLLLLGVVFSSLEFIKSYKLSSFKSPENEIEISANKLALKTSLQGILLLAVSFGFYALFVIYVLPVQQIS